MVSKTVIDLYNLQQTLKGQAQQADSKAGQ